jgi:hypothetical protein
MSNMRKLALFIVPFCISLNISAVNIYTLKKDNVDCDSAVSYISNTINHLTNPVQTSKQVGRNVEIVGSMAIGFSEIMDYLSIKFLKKV